MLGGGQSLITFNNSFKMQLYLVWGNCQGKYREVVQELNHCFIRKIKKRLEALLKKSRGTVSLRRFSSCTEFNRSYLCVARTSFNFCKGDRLTSSSEKRNAFCKDGVPGLTRGFQKLEFWLGFCGRGETRTPTLCM